MVWSERESSALFEQYRFPDHHAWQRCYRWVQQGGWCGMPSRRPSNSQCNPPVGRGQSEASPWRDFDRVPSWVAFCISIQFLPCWELPPTAEPHFSNRNPPKKKKILLKKGNLWFISYFSLLFTNIQFIFFDTSPLLPCSAPQTFSLQPSSALLTNLLSWNKNEIICLEPPPMSAHLHDQRVSSGPRESFSTQAARASPAPGFGFTPESSPAGLLSSRPSGPLATAGARCARSHCVSQAFFCVASPVPASPLGESLFTFQDSAPRTPQPL